MIENPERETYAVMAESEVGALLDAHDALVKACVEMGDAEDDRII
jgi:hypothetical protein